MPHLEWSSTQTTAPSVPPVTTAEAKAHLRVTASDDDTYIATAVEAARGWAEIYTNRQFITATWKLYPQWFPANGIIKIPRPPLQSVTSIQYNDTDGVQQTLAASIYDVDTEREPGRVVRAFDQSWPSIRNEVNPIVIELKAGYGDAASDVPDTIREALLLLVGHFYRNREHVVTGTVASEIQFSVEALLDTHKIKEFF